MQNYLNVDFNELAKTHHERMVRKSFWEGDRNVGELFMLIISELGEALEAHRAGKMAEMDSFERAVALDPHLMVWLYKERIKGSVEEELADVALRIMDYMAFKGYAIDATKPNKHIKDMDNFGEILLGASQHITDAYTWAKKDELLIFHQLHINIAFSSLFIIAEKLNIDLVRHIQLKMEYNLTRPAKHGKAY